MTLRTRLTIWSVSVLMAIVVTLAGGVYIFVRAKLLAQSEAELDAAWRQVRETCEHNPDDAYEAEKHGGFKLYEVKSAGTVLFSTEQWKRRDSGMYRTRTGRVTHEGRVIELAVAIDERPTRDAIHSLAMVLLFALPCAAALALLGGYFLAGRLLKPIGAMAGKAKDIHAERLSERLPVENPRDELGQLAAAFNDTLGRLQESFEQLRRFTADASHELRTPLTAMRSVGEVAIQKSTDPASREVLGSMLEETDRLSRLVESLLTLTRADAGAIKPDRKSVDVSSLARSAVDFLRVLAEEKEQTLSFDGKDGISAFVDPAILRQAIVNLVDNAIKYTPRKGQIRVRVERNGHGESLIDVTDAGPGIAKEHHERIFERFYRIDPARSREEGGVGLGLSIARWAVEVNGGRIGLKSELGAGSTFSIVLPALAS